MRTRKPPIRVLTPNERDAAVKQWSPLCWKRANSWIKNPVARRGCEREDLYQVAAMTVLRAIESYDPAMRVAKEKTYLHDAIDKELGKFVRQQLIVAVPDFQQRQIIKADKTGDESCIKLPKSESRIRGTKLRISQARDAMRICRQPPEHNPSDGDNSLCPDKVERDEWAGWEEFLGPDSQAHPIEVVRAHVNALPSPMREVLVRRMSGWTLERIGKSMTPSVARESVRDLEKRAIALLRERMAGWRDEFDEYLERAG